MTIHSYLLVLLIALPACKKPSNKENTDVLFPSSYTGYNQKGGAEICYPEKKTTECSPLSPELNAFRAACQNQGFSSYTCSCEKLLCSGNILSPTNQSASSLPQSKSSNPRLINGYGHDGNKKTCSPFEPTTLCTQEVTAGEEFAGRCRELGFKVSQCGCHEYLCSHNIEENK